MQQRVATRGLTADTLKIIAIVAMVIDHAAPAVASAESPLGLLLHFIGKLTGPIMCFFIAEGYHYTRNVKKYALRLLIFAAISQLPFQILFQNGRLIPYPLSLNMIFTLFCGLLALWAWDRIPNPMLRALAVVGATVATLWSDWSLFGVLFVLAFGVFHGDRKKQLIAFAVCAGVKILYNLLGDFIVHQSPIVELSRLGMFCVIPLLMLYNGTRKNNNFGKWFFYIFYPAHMLLFGVINLLFIGVKG